MVQSSPSAGNASANNESTSRSTRLAFGVAVVTLLIPLAVIGASAEHGETPPSSVVDRHR
jgi:hypothetical protein